MAEHAHTTNQSPNFTRRALALSGTAAAVGITTGTGREKLRQFGEATPHPDAELLAQRARLDAALRRVNTTESSEAESFGMTEDQHEDWVSSAGKELDDACWAIVDGPSRERRRGSP